MGEAPNQDGAARRPSTGDRQFIGHARTVMALTLVSRVSGMVRDAVCSRVFGTSPVWSAFVTAFIIPNLFRRLFGEGAASAAFIPEYAQLIKREPELADRFATATVALVLAVLGVVVVLLELALTGVLLSMSQDAGASRDVVVYAMVMLPFAPLVCATAMLGGMLQTHGRFVPHAASPVILNVCMIAAAATFAFGLGASLGATALSVSVAVLIAGMLQLSWCWWSLRTVVTWRRARGAGSEVGGRIRSMMVRMLPVLIGMGTLQLGTLIDGLIAGWPVIIGEIGPWGVAYPLDTGAASVLFFASRLYQFPLGVFGIAVATAVFPALSRQADEPEEFCATLRRGIRMSVFIGVPATVGLLLVARGATGVIYLGGEFDTEELTRVTRTLLAFAPAVWAYSLTHVLTRAFYAVGNTTLPMRVGIVTVCVNLTLNLVLMWWLAEAGLALATSIAAIGQCAVLSFLASSRFGAGGRTLLDPNTVRSIAWCIAAAGAMAAAVWLARAVVPLDGGIEDAPGTPAWSGYLWGLIRDVGVGGAAYVGLAFAMRRPELLWLLERGHGRASREG